MTVIKFKLADFFTTSKETLAAIPILLILGDDLLQKDMIVEHYARSCGLWPHAVETMEIMDARNLFSEWDSGSLMGARFLKINCPGKIKNPQYLERLFTTIPDSEDKMVLLVNTPWSGKTQEKARALVSEIECKEPKNAKQKVKLIEVRSKFKGLDLTPEHLKSLADRTFSTIEIETILTTLSLICPPGTRVTNKDINQVAGETISRRDITRSILLGITVRLNEEIMASEPLPICTAIFNALHRLYCFLCFPEDAEDDIVLRLKIHRFTLKDWRSARSKYSPQFIREILERVNKVYQRVRSGSTELWQEELRAAIEDLGKRL